MIKNKIYELSFSNQLINWYKKEKRNLPFRKTKDPYSVWLSEIILQQTQMKTGLKLLSSHDIAESILFAIKAPAHVNISMIEITPTEQTPGGVYIKKVT